MSSVLLVNEFTTIFRELLRKNYRMVKFDGNFNLQEKFNF